MRAPGAGEAYIYSYGIVYLGETFGRHLGGGIWGGIWERYLGEVSGEASGRRLGEASGGWEASGRTLGALGAGRRPGRHLAANRFKFIVNTDV